MEQNNQVNRGSKAADPAREDRAMQSRQTIALQQMSDREILDAFDIGNTVLPNLPDIPGFHVCWLSTQNQNDTIEQRLRQGYVPVTQDDIPGFKVPTLKTGEYAGMIGVNEMLAFKLPNRIYQVIMAKRHHREPKEQEGRVKDSYAELMRNQRQSGTSIMAGGGRGDTGSVGEFDGISTLATPNVTPDFVNPKVGPRVTSSEL